MGKGVTARDQRLAFERGETSAAALVETTLDRIAAVNPALNAVITLAEDRARAEAEHWDQQRKSGQTLPPLAGLPVLIKDNQRTAQIRTTLGSADHLNTIPDTDAGIVARLRAAGACHRAYRRRDGTVRGEGEGGKQCLR